MFLLSSGLSGQQERQRRRGVWTRAAALGSGAPHFGAMTRPVVPPALTRGPFTVVEAAAWGLTRAQLRSRVWRRQFKNVFVWAGLEDDAGLRAQAAAKVLPGEAAVSRVSAAWIWGVDLRRSVGERLEVSVPRGRAQRAWP